MKEGKKGADVEKALQHWTGSVIDPQLKPVQAKTRQLAEAALSLASSLESRCREFIRNSKYDMSGLGDSRRLRAEIEGLQRINHQTSQFRTRTRDITSTRDQIQEHSKILVEHLKTLQDLENSRVQLEKEIHQLVHNEGSLHEAIERIETDSEIRALNAKEAELK